MPPVILSQSSPRRIPVLRKSEIAFHSAFQELQTSTQFFGDFKNYTLDDHKNASFIKRNRNLHSQRSLQLSSDISLLFTQRFELMNEMSS